MNVKELRAVLEDLESILASANAKSQSKDTAAFIKLLDGADEQPVEQFLQELESRLQQDPGPVGPVVDPSLVDRYVKLLRDSGTDHVAFDAVFGQLVKDRAVDKPGIEAIAFAYIGYADGRRNWPSRKAALDAIEEWFRRIVFDAAKSVQLEKARYAG